MKSFDINTETELRQRLADPKLKCGDMLKFANSICLQEDLTIGTPVIISFSDPSLSLNTCGYQLIYRPRLRKWNKKKLLFCGV